MHFFFSSRRRHTRFDCDWSSDVCSSDLLSRRVTLARRVESLLVRVQDLLRERARWQRQTAAPLAQPAMPAREPEQDAEAFEASLREEIGRASCRERV